MNTRNAFHGLDEGLRALAPKFEPAKLSFQTRSDMNMPFDFWKKNHMSVWYSLLETVFIKAYHLALDNQNLVSYNLLFGLLKTFGNPTTDFILGPYLWVEIERSTVNILYENLVAFIYMVILF